jgi:arylsulfatase A-like enzyme
MPIVGASAHTPTKPNILFILCDDLGYGDVGVFFQNLRRTTNQRTEPWHITPKIDTLAREGAQLPQHYCPAPVCAPSRASLLLGVHQGHSNVRDNQFDKALEANHTLGTVLKQAGYATAAIGKWGLQGKPDAANPHGWPAHPMNRGFDDYFGYISHGAGHAHYPKEDRQALYEGAKDVAEAYDKCYTTDLFTARAKKWIMGHQAAHPQQPFFVYLAYDTPHAKLQLPPGPFPAGGGKTGGVQWLGQPGKMINTGSGTPDSYCYPDYANAKWDHDHNPATPEQPWPDVYQRFASDVRRIDDCVGDLLQLLKDLNLDNNTLVVFTSDNGPSKESYLKEPYEPTFFNSFGPFDGIKRDCWEGGIRVGALARWPGHIPANRILNEPSAFWDWMPTFAELAGVPAPARTDGISLLPVLTGAGTRKPSQLYWEYFVTGKTPDYNEFSGSHRGRVRQQMQAIRLGDFIGVRYNIATQADPFEIYNIATDPKQTNNLASQPGYAAMQQSMKYSTLRTRRPGGGVERPYDGALVPALLLSGATNGITWRAYTQAFPWVAKLETLTPSSQGSQARLDLSVRPRNQDFGLLFSGYLKVPADGEYTMSLTAGAGALLRIHEATVIDADFGHKAGEEVSAAIRLKAGQHPFHLYYTHGQAPLPSLRWQWSSSTLPKQEIPAEAFFQEGATEIQPPIEATEAISQAPSTIQPSVQKKVKKNKNKRN